ncbi:MAG TPA: D-aminoacyl-tRNA deacylase [Bryobacteraceae bacterium]|nr:D-aminoacyl-tRNA deacylase [Bryobacteraceae bacterium]
MRAVLQRVTAASVRVNNKLTGAINLGLLVLLGVEHADTKQDADYLVNKILGLRIFRDDSDKMNLSVVDVHGALLVVSQFTLYADCRKGMRPSFDRAAPSELAKDMYEYFVTQARNRGIPIETGAFQASMEVSLVNDGPVTVICESVRLTQSE